MTRIYYDRDIKNPSKDSMNLQETLKKFNALTCANIVEKREILASILKSVGMHANIENNFNCDIGKNISVGDNFYAGFNFTALDMAPITIGDNCMIGPNVGLYTSGHNFSPKERYLTGFGDSITIHNNVWIGGSCTILGGVVVGENSIIAAGSVVTKSIDKNSIYAGNPAKFIKKIEQ